MVLRQKKFCYHLPFCHKVRQCIHLTDRRKVRLLHDCNHNSHFLSVLCPQFIASQHTILALWSSSLLIQISSPHFLCCRVYIRHTFLTNALHCSRKRRCQNSSGRFWGWVKKGHRHCKASAKSRGSARSFCLQPAIRCFVSALIHHT